MLWFWSLYFCSVVKFVYLKESFYNFLITHFLPSQDNLEAQVVTSNDDILGDAIPQDQQNYLRQFCYQALKMTPGVGILQLDL